jgi:hypothetical protein
VPNSQTQTDGPIQPNTFCIACSYDLAGLNESAVCPECGMSCGDTLEKSRFRNEHATYLHSTCKGLRTTSIIYFTLAAVAMANIAIAAFQYRRLSRILITLSIAACLVSVLFMCFFGLLRAAEPAQNTMQKTRFDVYQRTLATTAIGAVVWILLIIPFALATLSATISLVAFFGLSLALLFVILSITGIANALSDHTGMKSTRSTAIAARVFACPLFALLTVSAIALPVAWQSKNGKFLGMNGGTWQDLFILSLASLAIVHALFTITFWIKLKSILDTSKP